MGSNAVEITLPIDKSVAEAILSEAHELGISRREWLRILFSTPAGFNESTRLVRERFHQRLNEERVARLKAPRKL